MKIAFTVDVEDWYHTSDLNLPVHSWPQYERRVEANTHHILALMDEYQAKGTFFVLGCVAKEFPALVRQIVSRGHELGCHGYWHQMLTRLSPEEVRADIADAKALLEHVSGVSVTAYRAPSWSIEPSTYYTLLILEELGFTIDSSFQPFRTPLSGIAGAPLEPFRPILDGKPLSILEIPSCLNSLLGLRYPFSGGLYLRTLPTWMVKWSTKSVLKERLAMLYVHPWEIDHSQPRITNSPVVRFTHYYNLGRTIAKLRRLLSEFTAVSLQELIMDNGSFPNVNLVKATAR